MPRKNTYQKQADEVELNSTTAEVALKRPTAPKTLSAEERVIWKETVSTRPIEFFTSDKIPQLIAYCKHSASMNHFYKVRATFYEYYNIKDIATDKNLLKQLNDMQLMINREMKSASDLAKDMGLTVKPDPKAKPETVEEKEPWEQ